MSFSAAVLRRPGGGSKRSTARQSKFQSHLDTNEDLHQIVSSILDADLDLAGVHRDTRVRSQLQKSLAQYTPENYKGLLTLKNKKKQLEVKTSQSLSPSTTLKALPHYNWFLVRLSF